MDLQSVVLPYDQYDMLEKAVHEFQSGNATISAPFRAFVKGNVPALEYLDDLCARHILRKKDVTRTRTAGIPELDYVVRHLNVARYLADEVVAMLVTEEYSATWRDFTQHLGDSPNTSRGEDVKLILSKSYFPEIYAGIFKIPLMRM